VKDLPGLRQIAQDQGRVIFEDPGALPLVHAAADPATPCSLSYFGNSLLITLRGIDSPLYVSVGPTDGWWYRLDGGPWLRPLYENDQLIVDPGTSARLLEVTYFDGRFREGLLDSLVLLLFLIILLIVQRIAVRRVCAHRLA
jgi:hypothetical protein